MSKRSRRLSNTISSAGYTYKMPPAECLSKDIAANIAFFHLTNTTSTHDSLITKIRAADQRKLFGGTVPIGKKTITFADQITYPHEICVYGALDRTGSMESYRVHMTNNTFEVLI